TLRRDRASGLAVSKEQVDQDRAAVSQGHANVQASKASLAVQELNVSFTKLTSPIDGRISSYFLTLGNLAVQDQTRLTTIVSQDPIYAYFDMVEPSVLQVRELIRESQLPSIREKRVRIPVDLLLSTDQ